MKNQNIQIGIDLGTTNSGIAFNNNGNVEIIERNGGIKYTPSVFGFDKAQNKVVGEKARNSLYLGNEEDFSNYYAEIKRKMGSPENIFFTRVNKEMSPEEISAEILKKLKEELLKKHPNVNTNSAVITIPAAFSSLQAEATKRAGNLAGFEHVVLLQEPIAAAISYGFNNTENNEKWLIYDFGGGTFDTALISLKDGNLSVLANNGDNFLGGKDIDWEIVNIILKPYIEQNFSVNNFSRKNKKYEHIFKLLKYIAEEAKIEISSNDHIFIDNENKSLGKDDAGKEINLSIDFYKKDFEKLIKPLIDKTIKLTQKTLEEASINKEDVKKIILVGGATQIPYIKKILKETFKIDIESTIDPLTVVAKGAACFAIGQQIPQNILQKEQIDSNILQLSLNYDSLTSETNQLITGSIEQLKDKNDDYYIQIQSENGIYDGSKIKLKNGKFTDTIITEKNKTCLYWIYVFDSQGNSLPININSFNVTHSISVSNPPLPTTIGILLAYKDPNDNFILKNKRKIIFEKGTPLPLYFREKFKTVQILKKEEKNNPLYIILDEGENENPEYNNFVCELGIKGKDLPYDLPEETEINIEINIDLSRQLTTTCYIPLIDKTIDARVTIEDRKIKIKDLEKDLDKQKKESQNILKNCLPNQKKEIENTITSLEQDLQNVSERGEEKNKINRDIKNLKIKLNEIKEKNQMPNLIKNFNNKIKELQKIIPILSTQETEKENIIQLKKFQQEGAIAIKENDSIMLIQICNHIESFIINIFSDNPATWINYFDDLKNKNHNFTNKEDAQFYIEKGEKALLEKDIETVKSCVKQLWLLIPQETPGQENISFKENIKISGIKE